MYRKLIYNLKTCVLLFTLSVVLNADTLQQDDSSYQSGNIDIEESVSSAGTLAAENRKVSFVKKYLQNFFSNSAEKLEKHINRIKTFQHYGIKLIVLFVSVVIIMVTLLFYLHKQDKARFMTTTRLSVMDKEVQKACRLIERKYVESSLTSRNVCDELVTGEAFLQALFKKELGMSIEDFISQVRINRSKILLNKNSGIGIDELVSETGFKDKDEFLYAFDKATGVGYEAFRKNMANG